MRKLATYEGIIEDGRVTLPPDTNIPNKTRVYVLVPNAAAQPTLHVPSPRLVRPEQAKDFEKQVIEETTDAEG